MHLASYAVWCLALSPAEGRIRHDGTCRNVNHYLKWGFVEVANCATRIEAYRQGHIGLPSSGFIPPKGTEGRSVAVARHLAEVSVWLEVAM